MSAIICIGSGFDVHAFDDQSDENNKGFLLGGVRISHKYPIKAHSDGDILLHGLTDAILGAIGGGSIGVHFPPSDEQWKDCSSKVFVRKALDMLAEKGGWLNNIDCTVICQAPKIMPYAADIKDELYNLVKVPKERINIKAVTTEWLGFIGRGEGIAVQVSCIVSLPS